MAEKADASRLNATNRILSTLLPCAFSSGYALALFGDGIVDEVGEYGIRKGDMLGENGP